MRCQPSGILSRSEPSNPRSRMHRDRLLHAATPATLGRYSSHWSNSSRIPKPQFPFFFFFHGARRQRRLNIPPPRPVMGCTPWELWRPLFSHHQKVGGLLLRFYSWHPMHPTSVRLRSRLLQQLVTLQITSLQTTTAAHGAGTQ